MGENPWLMTSVDLASKYLFVKEFVRRQGYEKEIRWQSSLNFDDLEESDFLRELAWVILSSGLKENIIRRIFKDVSRCFYEWDSAKIIVDNEIRCFEKAVNYFNNKSKISAIIYSAHEINNIGFNNLRIQINENPIKVLQEFPYIGPVTVYHLAKNIGFQFAKPDRHLVRIAHFAGYSDVQTLCEDISSQVGDSIPVVDIVLWRYATLDKNYESIFKIKHPK